MKIKTIFLLIALVVCFSIYGQNVSPLDELYTPPKTSNFGRNSQTAKISDRTDDERCANALRLSILDFTRSQVRLVYERKLGKYIGVSAGYGWSYGNDVIDFNSMILMEDFNGQVKGGVSLVGLRESSKFKSGHSYSTTIKYFFNIEPPTSNFIELGYRYARINYQSLEEVYLIPTSDNQFESRYHHISLAMGYQWTYGAGKARCTHEISYGIGMKYFSWDKYLPSNERDITGDYARYDKQAGQSISDKCPIFTVRYQLGVGW